MFEKIKGNVLFEKLLSRPDINNAYKMVPPTDSWYDTISTVHKSLETIQKLPHEILEITSVDNLKLKGVYYSNNSDITVVCAHGYTSHAEREWAFPGLFYLSLGYNVLIPYQRAHGLSEGKYISLVGLEHLDMMKWIDLVNEKHPNGKIIVHGLSMGGGIVITLSDKELRNVKCLIADAPSISVEGFFRRISSNVFKSNQDKIADFAIKRYNKEFGCLASTFEGFKIIQNCRYPMLLSAGSNEHLEEMFEQLKNLNPKQTEIIILPGCNHGNGMYKQTKMYQDKIIQFIDQYI